MSVGVYESGLRTGSPVVARYDDGSVRQVDLARWCGPARGADPSFLARLSGSVLDVGCGPGRLVSALTQRGVPVLGIDISTEAVSLARAAGGQALVQCVFDDVPGAGSWDWCLLIDGNIGIGGDPARLLRRAHELLRPTGRILVEVGAPRSATRRTRLRLETAQGSVGSWFSWADVGIDSLTGLAGEAGLTIVESWSVVESPTALRWFAVLGAT